MQQSARRPGGASSGISNHLTKFSAENTPLDRNQLPLHTETSQAVPRGGCLAICFTYRATAVRVSASVMLLCVPAVPAHVRGPSACWKPVKHWCPVSRGKPVKQPDRWLHS